MRSMPFPLFCIVVLALLAMGALTLGLQTTAAIWVLDSGFAVLPILTGLLLFAGASFLGGTMLMVACILFEDETPSVHTLQGATLYVAGGFLLLLGIVAILAAFISANDPHGAVQVLFLQGQPIASALVGAPCLLLGLVALDRFAVEHG